MPKPKKMSYREYFTGAKKKPKSPKKTGAQMLTNAMKSKTNKARR